MKKLGEWLQSERERWVLWLPVGLAAGMLLYFSLPGEPASYALLPLLGLPVAVRYVWRRWRAVGWVGVGACVIAAGFVVAKTHTDRMDVRLLEKELKFAPITGRVVELGDVSEGFKLTLDEVAIDGLPPEKTPRKVRVTLRGAGQDILTGDRVSMRAGLLPPAGPVMPGGFDFARYFYFKGIGAVGYAVPPVERARGEGREARDVAITRFRQQLSERIRGQMSEAEGAVAAALMVGDRAAIPDDVAVAMRDANLSHVLAISGMHMAIITGLLFVGLRYGLLLPRAMRDWRYTKQCAAAVALAVGAAYLAVSGMPISAVRAFVMVALLLGAVLINREVMPMRSLMLAAVLLLLYNPANVLEPGFQLSFVATAALIAWYERVHLAALDAGEQWSKRAAIYLGGILTTSLVAELPTNFLVLYHFNSLSLYGMLANMLVMPLVSFVIMPAVIVAFALMPLGLEAWPLHVMEWGIHAMIVIAKWVVSIPYAQFFLPAFPGWSMAVIMLGIFWVILWRRRVRWCGLAIILVGLSGWFTVELPDFFISKDGKQIAGRIDGELMMLKGRAHSFMPMQWANGSGERKLGYYKAQAKAPHPNPLPEGEGSVRSAHANVGEDKNTLSLGRGQGEGKNSWRCDAVGCVYRRAGQVVALAQEHEALVQDCARAQVVVAPFYVDEEDCPLSPLPNPPPEGGGDAQAVASYGSLSLQGEGWGEGGRAAIIDRGALTRKGSHWIWVDARGVRVEATADVQGMRPWSR